MKTIRLVLCCFLMLLFTACSSAGKYYEEGITNLNTKNYIAAESSLKKAIDAGYNKDNINVVYAIVSEYNNAKKSYDAGEYDKTREHIDKIPYTYSDYLIGIDINFLKDELKKIEEVATSISKAKTLFDEGDYEEANVILFNIDSKYTTDEQTSEIDQLKHDIKLKKKNNDYEVLRKIDSLVETYVYGLCEAVNKADFRPLKGSLYEGSSIYNTQKSYIAAISKEDIYEYVEDFSVDSVNWYTETSCIITTSETYTIFDGLDSRTQTFKYTYDVIETKDKQLFLTSIEKSN